MNDITPTPNRYAPPTARVEERYGLGDDDDAVQPVHPFSVRGRVGRMRMIAYWLYSTLIYYAVMAVLGVLGAALGATSTSRIVVGFIALVCMLPMLWFSICMMAQRSHDMGWSAWTALWTLIPFVALLWIFAAGTPGRNRFGAPPPPNSAGVKVGFWLMVALMVLGMLVGILAAVLMPHGIRG
jgi:uncharacterized membrane protein YhaH (DUF805 family)